MSSAAARTVRPVEEQAERALIRPRSLLLFGRSPATSFFAPLALRLQTKITRDVPTMATDGRSLFANPEFALGLSESETAAVLIHEVLHCVHHHNTRRAGRDPKIWNIACDLAVNTAVDETEYRLPEGAIYARDFKFPDGLTADNYFAFWNDT